MTVLARPEVILDGDWSPLDRTLRNASRAMERVGANLERVGRRLALTVTAPIAALGVASIKAAVDMDALKRALEVSAGSAEAAAGQLKVLERVAELPGLGFREAIQGALQLNVAFGEMPNRIQLTNRALEQFGNAVGLSGKGRAELDRVIVQLSQIAAVGKVLQHDLRPIIQTAPAVATALRDAFGTIDPEQINQLGLSSEEFLNKLIAALERLPRANTGAKNAFENLTDSVFRARVAVGDLLLPAVTKLVDITARLAEGLTEVDRSTIAWGIALGGIAAAIPLVIITAGVLVSSLASVIAGLTALNAVLAAGGIAAIATGGGLVLGVAALAAAFAFAYTKIKGAADQLDRIGQGTLRDFSAMSAEALREEIALLERRQEILRVGLGQNLQNDTNRAFLAQTTRELVAARAALEGMSEVVETRTIPAVTALSPQMLNLDGASSALAANIELVAVGGERAAAVFGDIDHLAGLTVETFDSAGQSVLRFTDAMRQAEQITLAVRTPTEVYHDTLAVLDAHLQAGRITWETYTRAVEAATEALKEANEAASGGLGIFGKIGSALGRFGSLASIAGLAIPGIGQIAGISSILGSFAGGFAEGGYIPSGQWGIVGERGPEVVRGPASVSPGAMPQINVPPARDPMSFARDQQWVRAIVEAFRTAEEGGFRPQPA